MVIEGDLGLMDLSDWCSEFTQSESDRNSGELRYQFTHNGWSLEAGNGDRAPATIKVTPSLAIESFRHSFLLNDSGGGDEEIDLDAILGELCEIENQLKFQQQSHDLSSGDTIISNESLHDAIGRMDAGANVNDAIDSASKTQAWINSTPPPDQMVRPEQWKRQSQVSHASSSSSNSHKSQPLSDVDRDSAYLENESLPSSESYLSVGTNSSNPSSHGSHGNHHLLHGSPQQHQTSLLPHERLEIMQANKLKEEKIKIALEKIKDTKLERLFIRAYGDDGSSKAILVDEGMDSRRVWQLLIEKNHSIPDLSLAVVEHLPSLYMERVLEDHDNLVSCKLSWPRDSQNRILFTKRPIKYDLFRFPELFLLGESDSDKGSRLDRNAKACLLEEFFSTNQVSEVEGMLYIKSEGKKVWKKAFCVLRASGIYYNPKGKSKSSRDLQLLVSFENEELYLGLGWKKKYKSPTDYTFALKHPMVMKKSCKFIKYFCAEDELSFRRWYHGIRVAKHGHVMFHNYRECCYDVQLWDSRVAPTLTSPGNKVKVTTSLQRRESLPSSPRHKLDHANRRASTNVESERAMTDQRFFPTEHAISDNHRGGDYQDLNYGHDSGHESTESIPRRPQDEGTLKKSSRVPILPVTTDTAKSLTLKRTDYVPTQRASILNGDMTIQRNRKMSDGDINVKNWRQSRNEDVDNGNNTNGGGHSRKSSLADFGHGRRKSLESESILRDSPPRELTRSETMKSEFRGRLTDTIKRSPKPKEPEESVYDEPYNMDLDAVNSNSVLPPPMGPISLPCHLDSERQEKVENPYSSIEPEKRESKRPHQRMSVPPPPPPNPARPPSEVKEPPPTAPKPRRNSKSSETSPQEPVYHEPPSEIDLDALPPPPPELLAGLDSPDLPQMPEPMGELCLETTFRKESSPLRGGGSMDSPVRKKAPPPPPKRSSTTQLSQRT